MDIVSKMSEETLGNIDEQNSDDANAAELEGGTSKRGRRRKIILAVFVAIAAIFIVVALLIGTGTTDRYVKAQFSAKMHKMGIAFESDSFKIGYSPLTVHITNAKFTDRQTGANLIFIKDAKIDLTVQDFLALRFTRNISIDSTEISGAEIFVDFDENGRSNFSNVLFVEEDDAIKVSFRASKLSLRDSIVRFGDVQRRISAESGSLSASVEPQDAAAPDEKKTYGFRIDATDAFIRYDQNTLENIDIAANGTFDSNGAEIAELSVKSPAGDSRITGKVEGWNSPRFDLNIESTVDLTAASQILPMGAPIEGVGKFSGKISGRGEDFKIEGDAVSDSITASNLSLKGLDVTAALEGREGAYEASGKALAKMLTFGDFQIDYLQLSGLIRGTGTDFKWFGELQAAAAKTKSGTIGGLFISDAIAEGNEKRYSSTFGRTRAAYYSLDDLLIGDIEVADLAIAASGGVTQINATSASAANLKTKDIRLGTIRSGRIDIRDQGDTTDIKTPRLESKSGRIGDFDFMGLSSDNVAVRHRKGVTDITADGLSSQNVSSSRVKFGAVSAKELTIRDTDDELVAMSNGVMIARVESDAAVLGSLNIAGVRMTVREGTIEFKSDDFTAENVDLPPNSVFASGGRLNRIRVTRPVFVVEDAGTYRASADMSLGGGAIGSVKLGSARASVTVTNQSATLQNLSAALMDGTMEGDAAIALTDSARSQIDVRFMNLDLAKLFAVGGGNVVPIAGQADGTASFGFPGTDIRKATGRVTADIDGNSSDPDGAIAVTGKIDAQGANGLFNLMTARLQTAASSLDAKGRIDLAGDASDLDVRLVSADAREVERFVRAFEFSPEIQKRIGDYRVELAGTFELKGKVLGDIADPVLNAKASVQDFGVRGVSLGSLRTEIFQSPDIFELKNGLLSESDGGSLSFSLRIPEFGSNNATFTAKVNNVNTGSVIAVLPFAMPESLRGLKADMSGDVALTGLPDAMQGRLELSTDKASIGDDEFDRIEATARFEGTTVAFDKLRMSIGDGYAEAVGVYKTDSTDFDFTLEGKKVPLAKLRALLTSSKNFPQFDGVADLTGRAAGKSSDTTTYNVEFTGAGKNVSVNGTPIGNLSFSGRTTDRLLDATFESGDSSSGQTIRAKINFAEPKLRFSADSIFNKASLDPYISSIRAASNVAVTGRATGTIRLEGNLLAPDSNGELAFALNGLAGRADFSQFEIQIDQTPLVATEPVAVAISDEAIDFERATFAGGGSNLKISGTRALSESADNNISMVGRINLALLNPLVTDTFFAGIADVNVRLNGPNATARLNGRADMVSASVSTFVSSERVSVERLKGTVIFTSNQAQIEKATGVIGGGTVTISGGAVLGEDLLVDAMKFDLRGDNITVPLPKSFVTTGDASLSVNARRVNGELRTFISGRINATRSQYSTNIDLADIIGQRKDSPLNSTRSTTGYSNIGVDLIVEGRDALVVRNNLADLTASLSLRVTGDIDTPQVAGRITANSGTIFFRNERYEVQRLELVFPPNTNIEPIINLQAEAEIKGYQVIASLSGSLSDTDTLNVNVRSNPALPQADVVSLITTGNLANTESGISTSTQSGISAAADILTDEIISKPISKATDKLFGLNRFGIDPIISGQRLNPTARLTVGRQINRNLLVTYSTNLAQDQNRVLALEYRLSNRFSVVAQYEQRSLANVTQRSNAFSFEIRVRKRF